jgi:hypothetical protein
MLVESWPDTYANRRQNIWTRGQNLGRCLNHLTFWPLYMYEIRRINSRTTSMLLMFCYHVTSLVIAKDSLDLQLPIMIVNFSHHNTDNAFPALKIRIRLELKTPD